MRVVVKTDGAAQPTNPGPAGAGFVVELPGMDALVQGYAALGERTNNEAEYEAVIRGLRLAADMGATEVAVLSDSQLLVRQLQGTYEVRAEHLVPLFEAVKEQVARIASNAAKVGFVKESGAYVFFDWVPRELNADADRLARMGAQESAGDASEGADADFGRSKE
jgi:ribonuclease HI